MEEIDLFMDGDKLSCAGCDRFVTYLNDSGFCVTCQNNESIFVNLCIMCYKNKGEFWSGKDQEFLCLECYNINRGIKK